jgi:hypothetical protein
VRDYFRQRGSGEQDPLHRFVHVWVVCDEPISDRREREVGDERGAVVVAREVLELSKRLSVYFSFPRLSQGVCLCVGGIVQPMVNARLGTPAGRLCVLHSWLPSRQP